MGLLDQQMAFDSAAFVDTDAFGESVTYRKKRTGAEYTFPALVTRKIPAPVLGAPAPAPSLTVFIRKNSDTTIGVPSVDTGSDVVVVAERLGGTAEEHRIVSVEFQDAGGWRLKLR